MSVKREKKKQSNDKHRLRTVLLSIFWILVIVMLFFSVITTPLLSWYDEKFGVSFSQIYHTITGKMEGADTSFLFDALKCIRVSAVFVCFAAIGVLILEHFFSVLDISIRYRIFALKGRISVKGVFRFLSFALTVVLFTGALIKIDNALGITEYLTARTKPTTIYEDYYVDPSSVSITNMGEKRNLIMIYLESMETTYAPQEIGGFQKVNNTSDNYIPGLTYFADEYISFSNSELLGGFHSVSGTGWTYASIFAQSVGIPYSFDNVEIDTKKNNYTSSAKAIGDILSENGYNQEFLCGSNASFANRDDFFKRHGDYEIFDYNTAIEKGYIAPDYKVWWGLEDKILYKMAKDEAVRLSELGEPFNLTMLTVDTHHVEGYVCDLCDDTYDEQLANVLDCADNQIEDFIDWCQKQDFYDDTTIVIVGDHPRMDNYLVGGVDYYDRTVYNCFINAVPKYDAKDYVNREFSAMDMFPTTLSALGFKIEGNRLGLGVDMFSGEQTLMEKLGYEEMDKELSGFSKYYNEHFY